MPRRRSILAPALHAVRRFLLEHDLDSFPLRDTLRRYSAWKFQKDTSAAVNVAMLAITQGMAYAMIAGLPSVSAGIMGAALAALIAPLFCSSRHTVIGPTNTTALLLSGALVMYGGGSAQSLPLLVFLAGLLLVIGAWLRFADLIQYVSRSVITGYVTGAGLLIIGGQLGDALGMPEGSGRTFFTGLADTLSRLDEANGPSLLIAGLTIAAYFALRRYTPRIPAFVVTLLTASLVVAIFRYFSQGTSVPMLKSFALRDLVPVLPDFTATGTMDALSTLFGPALALAFIIGLEVTVMAKTLAARSGDRPEVNQDMLAAGIANLGCAFGGGMPASGSPTRSMLNFVAGAQTPIATLLCGVFCLIAALTTGPLVKYVPQPALAALVICVAIALISPRQIRICLRATASDALTLVVTVLGSLILPLHVAIFLGVAVSVVLYLRKASRPVLVEYEFDNEGDLKQRDTRSGRQNPAISIVHVEGELFFGAAELFRTQIQRTVRDPNLRIIILRMKNARHLDATSVMALEELITFLRSKQRHLIISGLSKDVYRVLRNAGMIPVVGRENIFMGSAQNPNLSTRNALKRAQSLLGGAKADVQIWYDPSRPQEG